MPWRALGTAADASLQRATGLTEAGDDPIEMGGPSTSDGSPIE